MSGQSSFALMPVPTGIQKGRIPYASTNIPGFRVAPGVTLLPELSVSTELRFPDLCVRYFAEPAPCRTIALVWRKRSTLAPALR